MKGLYTVLLYFIGLGLYAQEGSVGIGTQTPNEKAVLHLVAPNNDQGFLVPKMTTAEKTSFGLGLTANENGMMVYDTDLDRFFFWMTDHWEAVGSSLQAGNGISISDGVISNTGDTDPANELQDLSLTNNILTISGLSNPTQINLEAYQNNTDEQDLQFVGGVVSLTGDPDNTQIDLAPYLELPGTATEGEVLGLMELPGVQWLIR